MRRRASAAAPAAMPAGASQASRARAAIASPSKYRGAQGLDPEFIKKLEKQFGFDKPPLERFCLMMRNYLTFDFGESYFRDISVLEPDHREDAGVDLARPLDDAASPISISIPLGIRKAVKDGSHFDVWTIGRHHRRLCHSGLPLRDPADRAVRRRLLLRAGSRCAA